MSDLDDYGYDAVPDLDPEPCAAWEPLSILEVHCQWCGFTEAEHDDA